MIVAFPLGPMVLQRSLPCENSSAAYDPRKKTKSEILTMMMVMVSRNPMQNAYQVRSRNKAAGPG